VYLCVHYVCVSVCILCMCTCVYTCTYICTHAFTPLTRTGSCVPAACLYLDVAYVYSVCVFMCRTDVYIERESEREGRGEIEYMCTHQWGKKTARELTTSARSRATPPSLSLSSLCSLFLCAPLPDITGENCVHK
jgi:hypothetical protein